MAVMDSSDLDFDQARPVAVWAGKTVGQRDDAETPIAIHPVPRSVESPPGESQS